MSLSAGWCWQPSGIIRTNRAVEHSSDAATHPPPTLQQSPAVSLYLIPLCRVELTFEHIGLSNIVTFTASQHRITEKICCKT